MAGVVGLVEDLMWEILIRLPVESVLRCKLVCKLWLSIITNPDFVSRYTLTSSKNTKYILIYDSMYIAYRTNLKAVDSKSFMPTCTYAVSLPHPYNSFNIKGCCNGLLLGYVEQNWSDCYCYYYFLWNFATRQTKKLPHRLGKHSFEAVGFGFDPKSNDHKVVVMQMPINCNLQSFIVEIYRFREDRWRTLESFSNQDEDIIVDIEFDHLNGVFTTTANGLGMCSWLLRMESKLDRVCYEVVSLDMSNEVFVMTPLPDSISDYYDNRNLALVFNHSLAVVKHVIDMHPLKFDVWVLGEFGVKESWSMVFSVGPISLAISRNLSIKQLLGFWKEGNKAFLLSSCGRLFLYDQHNMTLEEVGKDIGLKINMFNYFETLISL